MRLVSHLLVISAAPDVSANIEKTIGALPQPDTAEAPQGQNAAVKIIRYGRTVYSPLR